MVKRALGQIKKYYETKVTKQTDWDMELYLIGQVR